MSISYTKINEGNGWTTQTSLGPTNLNHMEQGIKDACDAIDTECVQATDITPISAYELVSADVSTKAINDGVGNNIASSLASLSSGKLDSSLFSFLNVSRFEVSSNNGVLEIQAISENPSSNRPSVAVDFTQNNIVCYMDMGSGFSIVWSK